MGTGRRKKKFADGYEPRPFVIMNGKRTFITPSLAKYMRSKGLIYQNPQKNTPNRYDVGNVPYFVQTTLALRHKQGHWWFQELNVQFQNSEQLNREP